MNRDSQIAIAGAGMAGAYLYRLLRRLGRRVDIYDRIPDTRCGISACAWGTSRGFAEGVAAAGLIADNYILNRFDHVFMDEVEVAADLLTFDKPRLIKDLLADAEVRQRRLAPGAYARVVDATGVARAFLPAVADDVVLDCVQCRLAGVQSPQNKVNLGRIGYAWCFPLAGRHCHIGCGSLIGDPRRRLDTLGWRERSPDGGPRVVCECRGRIRLTGPRASRPFVARNVWGVGEAIGCVAPLAGDGIVPGMKSVQLLIRHWNNPEAYTRAVLKAFDWMAAERRVLDKLQAQKRLGMRDALVLKRNSKRMGMQIGLREAAKLLHRLR